MKSWDVEAYGNDLPPGWAWAKLEEVADVAGGVAKGRDLTGKQVVSVPYLRVANVQRGYLDLSEIKTIEILSDEREKYALQSGDVLFTEGGDADKLGRSVVWRGEVPGCINQNHVFRVRLLTEELRPEWLMLCANSPYGRAYFQNAAKQTTNLASINLSQLAFFRLPVPPLREQEQIIRRVEELLAVVNVGDTALRRLIVAADRYEAAVFKSACQGRLVPQDPDDHLVGQMGQFGPDMIPDNEARPTLRLQGDDRLPPLPDGWCRAFLPQLGNLDRGRSRHRPRDDARLYGGPYPFIQTGDVRRSNGLICNYRQTYSEFGLAQSRLWPAGTLCISIAANIADTGVLTFPACFPDSVVGFVPRPGCEVRYVEMFIRSIKARIEQYAPATAQKNINLSVLERIAVPLPPLAEQKRIVAEVDRRLSVLWNVKAIVQVTQKRAERLRRAILKKAFTGRLVPQDPTDEPASALLDRLRKARQQQAPAPKRRPCKSGGAS